MTVIIPCLLLMSVKIPSSPSHGGFRLFCIMCFRLSPSVPSQANYAVLFFSLEYKWVIMSLWRNLTVKFSSLELFFFFITLQELFCTSWIFNITRLSYKYAGFYFAGADYVLLEV